MKTVKTILPKFTSLTESIYIEKLFLKYLQSTMWIAEFWEYTHLRLEFYSKINVKNKKAAILTKCISEKSNN